MEKIKMMIKVLIYINTLFIMIFYLSPANEVSAAFTDAASSSAGIKLTLGNLSLSPEKDETTTGLTYLGGDPVLLSSHELKNDGTLDGKLAYKIQVTEKGTSIPVNDSGFQIIINYGSTVGDKIISASDINSGNYTFLTDIQNKEWVFSGNQKKNIPVTIKYKGSIIPDKDRDIDITVTFLLVQTNVSKPKEAMFYDKVTFKHELKLKAKEVPSPSDPKYWPAANDVNWKTTGPNNEVRYNIGQFKNVMYFSEVDLSNRVKNLNDNVLYIELPEGKLKKDDDFRITQIDGSHVKAEVMEDRQRIKLTFSFDKSAKGNEKLLSQANYYTVSFNFGTNNTQSVNFGFDLLPLTYKRILLNTDKQTIGNFEILPIYTTVVKNKITFKQTKEDNFGDSNYIQYPLDNANFSYSNLEAKIVEQSALFEVSMHKAVKDDNQDYLLINTSKAAKQTDMNKRGKLKITIVGNNGNCLVIYRDLFIK
ncbi:hypothetical protein [Carnobacterium jeotgali]|uniref:hypothetical protein n=1 Tax=Carnobacterium jeotgali TaxID=545534 RepID=UPI003C721E24